MSTAPQTPAFDPGAPHQQRPKLRPIRGFPAQTPQGQQLIGLADARQVSDRVVYTSPAAQHLLPLMDGTRTIEDLVKQVGRGLTPPVLQSLVAQLDEAGLLFGPKFDAMLARMHKDFDDAPVLPPASTAAFFDALGRQKVEGEPEATDDAARAALSMQRFERAMQEWKGAALKDAARSAFETLPKAIVAPHIDYPRGWLNYAAVWGRMPVQDRPSRIVILGTNHFGFSTGVCGCDKGYESPLGVCAVDQDLVATLRRRLGKENADRLFQHRFDHEREHSIELQVPWIQHTFGPDASGQFPKVFGALVHDPTVNSGESYDGSGLGFDPFVDALRDAIAELPGKTLVVASADLSHCGPSFGDQQPLAGETPQAKEAREKIFQHDREMLDMLVAGKPDELIASMSWQQNPTRWCSIGNMVAAYRVVRPERVEMFNYAAAMDQQGYALVSTASLAML